MINIIRTIKNLSGVDALNNTPSVIDWLTTWRNIVAEDKKIESMDFQLDGSTLTINIQAKPITMTYNRLEIITN